MSGVCCLAGWPCNLAAPPNTSFNQDPWSMDVDEAKAIENGGPCNTTTGLPWMERDGYPRSDNTDQDELIAMTTTIETLTLAWWFTQNKDDVKALSYLNSSLLVFRTW